MEAGAAKVAISADFLTAFAALPRKIQGKVTEFINKFRNNPQSPGINYEKINGGMDKKIWSVRIDNTYRGITVRQPETGVYLLLWVDHHDAAYDWARSKKCDVNPKTGAIQVYDVITTPVEESVPVDHALFAEISDEALIELGVPEEQISFIRTISDDQEFFAKKGSFSGDTFEALSWIVEGLPIEEVVELFNSDGSKRVLIHRLVAMAFIPNPDDLPQVNHKDENPSNNHVDNLEWCTAKYNMNYGDGAKTRHSKIDYSKPCYKENAIKNGKAVSVPVFMFSKNGSFLTSFNSIIDASIATGIHRSNIGMASRGERKTAGGYVWKRGNDLSVCQY